MIKRCAWQDMLSTLHTIDSFTLFHAAFCQCADVLVWFFLQLFHSLDIAARAAAAAAAANQARPLSAVIPLSSNQLI